MVFGRKHKSRKDPYRGHALGDFLGGGGFGKVWRATDHNGFSRALKLIDLTQDVGVLEFKGLQSIKGIRHPNLNAILDYWFLDRDDNVLTEDVLSGEAARLVIVMDLGDGSLRFRLKQCQEQGNGGIPWKELLEYTEAAAEALDYMHRSADAFRGGTECIIHRDIKPENILVMGGSAQVCDFGLARAFGSLQKSRTAARLGTPEYMAPEVLLEEHKPEPASDQFSLAVTYYELRTGKLPYKCSGAELTWGDVLRAHAVEGLDLAELENLEEQAVVAKAAHRDYRERYPTCRDMVDALREVYRKWSQGHEDTRQAIFELLQQNQFEEAASACEEYLQRPDGSDAAVWQSILLEWQARFTELIGQSRWGDALSILQIRPTSAGLLQDREELWNELLQSFECRFRRRISTADLDSCMRDLRTVENDTTAKSGRMPPRFAEKLNDLQAEIRTAWWSEARSAWPKHAEMSANTCRELLTWFPNHSEARLLHVRALVRLGNAETARPTLEALEHDLPEELRPLHGALMLMVQAYCGPPADEDRMCSRIEASAGIVEAFTPNTPEFWQLDPQEREEIELAPLRPLMKLVLEHVEAGCFDAAKRILESPQLAVAGQAAKKHAELWETVIALRDPQTGRERLLPAVATARNLLGPGSTLAGDECTQVYAALTEATVKRDLGEQQAVELDAAIDLVRASRDHEAADWMYQLLVRRLAVRVLEDRPPAEAEFRQFEGDWQKARGAGRRDELVNLWRAECLALHGKGRRALEIIPDEKTVADDQRPYLQFVRALALSADPSHPWEQISGILRSILESGDPPRLLRVSWRWGNVERLQELEKLKSQDSPSPVPPKPPEPGSAMKPADVSGESSVRLHESDRSAESGSSGSTTVMEPGSQPPASGVTINGGSTVIPAGHDTDSLNGVTKPNKLSPDLEKQRPVPPPDPPKPLHYPKKALLAGSAFLLVLAVVVALFFPVKPTPVPSTPQETAESIKSILNEGEFGELEEKLIDFRNSLKTSQLTASAIEDLCREIYEALDASIESLLKKQEFEKAEQPLGILARVLPHSAATIKDLRNKIVRAKWDHDFTKLTTQGWEKSLDELIRICEDYLKRRDRVLTERLDDLPRDPDETTVRLWMARALVRNGFKEARDEQDRLSSFKKASDRLGELSSALSKDDKRWPLYCILDLIVLRNLDPRGTSPEVWEQIVDWQEQGLPDVEDGLGLLPDKIELAQLDELTWGVFDRLVASHWKRKEFTQARGKISQAETWFPPPDTPLTLSGWKACLTLLDPVPDRKERIKALNDANQLLGERRLGLANRNALGDAIAGAATWLKIDEHVKIDHSITAVRAAVDLPKCGDWLRDLWRERVKSLVLEDSWTDPDGKRRLEELKSDWKQGERDKEGDSLVLAWRMECQHALKRGLPNIPQDPKGVPKNLGPYVHYVRALALADSDTPDWQKVVAEVALALPRPTLSPCMYVRDRWKVALALLAKTPRELRLPIGAADSRSLSAPDQDNLDRLLRMAYKYLREPADIAFEQYWTMRIDLLVKQGMQIDLLVKQGRSPQDHIALIRRIAKDLDVKDDNWKALEPLVKHPEGMLRAYVHGLCAKPAADTAQKRVAIRAASRLLPRVAKKESQLKLARSIYESLLHGGPPDGTAVGDRSEFCAEVGHLVWDYRHPQWELWSKGHRQDERIGAAERVEELFTIAIDESPAEKPEPEYHRIRGLARLERDEEKWCENLRDDAGSAIEEWPGRSDVTRLSSYELITRPRGELKGPALINHFTNATEMGEKAAGGLPDTEGPVQFRFLLALSNAYVFLANYAPADPNHDRKRAWLESANEHAKSAERLLLKKEDWRNAKLGFTEEGLASLIADAPCRASLKQGYAYEDLAWLLEHDPVGHYKKAIEHYRKAARSRIAETVCEGRLGVGRSFYRAAEKTKLDKGQLQLALGVLSKSEALSEAIRELNLAKEANSKSAQTWLYLGCAYEAQPDFEKARENYDRAKSVAIEQELPDRAHYVAAGVNLAVKRIRGIPNDRLPRELDNLENRCSELMRMPPPPDWGFHPVARALQQLAQGYAYAAESSMKARDFDAAQSRYARAAVEYGALAKIVPTPNEPAIAQRVRDEADSKRRDMLLLGAAAARVYIDGTNGQQPARVRAVAQEWWTLMDPNDPVFPSEKWRDLVTKKRDYFNRKRRSP